LIVDFGLTKMGWLDVGTVSCGQGLTRLACVETVFPNTISNGLLGWKCFQNIFMCRLLTA